MSAEDWTIYIAKRWHMVTLRGYVFEATVVLPAVNSHPPFLEANILINRNGQARIADFSLLTIIPDKAHFLSATSFIEGGSTRWMSPELLDPDRSGFGDGRPTKESDCYAFGMVIYEVLSGQVPFAQDKNTVVIQKVMKGGRPSKPRGAQGVWFTDGLWGMLELCWKPQPSHRPSLKTLFRRLEGIKSPLWLLSPTPTVSECMVTTADDPWDSNLDDFCFVQGLQCEAVG